MDILLFSNGKNSPKDRLLQYGEDELERQIKENNIKSYVLVPYAVIRDTYEKRVNDLQETVGKFGVKVHSITEFKTPVEAILKNDAIAISGGNTWFLNRSLHDNHLISTIRKAVLKDGKPYIGWSAGTNVAGPTILTTNDMPIIESVITPSLNFVPFQINPHYIDSSLEGHMGETRDERLAEFLIKNPHQLVVGIKESSYLKFHKGTLSYKSFRGDLMKVFSADKAPLEFKDTDDLSFLLENFI